MDANHVTEPHAEDVILAVSLELAVGKWKVALHDGRREKPAVHTVEQPQAQARLQAMLDLIERQKEKWSLPADVRGCCELRSWPGRVLDLPRIASAKRRLLCDRSSEYSGRTLQATRED